MASLLVIDDEPKVSAALRRALEHQVTSATTAKEALALLEAGQRFDLVLCDVMMPDMPTSELHRRLGNLVPQALERVVYLTGGPFTATAQRFLDEVPNQRLDKPVDVRNLRAMLRALLAPGLSTAESAPQPSAGKGPRPTRN